MKVVQNEVNEENNKIRIIKYKIKEKEVMEEERDLHEEEWWLCSTFLWYLTIDKF